MIHDESGAPHGGRRHLVLMLAIALGGGRALARIPVDQDQPPLAGGYAQPSFVGGYAQPSFAGGYARPRAVAVDAREDLLYVALSTTNRLAVVDIAKGRARILLELPMCEFPDNLAPLPGGGVVVACRLDPVLRVVTRAAGASSGPRFDIRVVDAGPEHGHQGLAIHPSGRFAYVASPPRGGVKIVDLTGGGGAPGFVATGLAPRALRLGVSASGVGAGRTLLLVSNFIGHTVTIHDVRSDGLLSAALQTIVTEAPVLDLVALPSAPDFGDLSGALLLATHEDRILSREHLAVEGLDSVVLVLQPAIPGQGALFADPGPGKRRALNLTERAREALVGLDAMAFDSTSGRLAIAGAGSDNLLIAAPNPGTLLKAPATTVGANPSALAFLPDGRLVTADRLSDTLSFVGPISPGHPGGDVRTVEIGRSERRTPGERGELLFYSSALLPNNVAAGPLSLYTCAACHADGQIDGRRHPSKRNRFFSMTKTCRGLGGTEPFLSIGKPETFAAFADNIVATHAQGALDAPRTFDRYPVQLRLRHGDRWRNVTLSPEQVRAALAAYMADIPLERSPFVTAGRRTLTAAERRGFVAFKENCARCHRLVRSTRDASAIPAAEIEARLLAGGVALTSADLYDVGTPVLGEGGNNPPSLRNVWAAAPYFSDGSAPTLADVLVRTNPEAAKVHAAENAGKPSPISPAVRDDLLAFLRAL